MQKDNVWVDNGRKIFISAINNIANVNYVYESANVVVSMTHSPSPASTGLACMYLSTIDPSVMCSLSDCLQSNFGNTWHPIQFIGYMCQCWSYFTAIRVVSWNFYKDLPHIANEENIKQ